MALPRAWRVLFGCLSALLVFAISAFLFLYYWCGAPSGPYFEREASPNGRYEIVRETRSFFLDGYTKLWITTRGEQDPGKWFLIAPEVDGTWHTDWFGPRELMLTNYGWPTMADPRKVVTWRDVRIEMRPPPSGSDRDSPDERHSVVVWTYEDSHGRRSGARLRTTWRNEPSGDISLLPEGHWSIEPTWLANDQLQLRVVPQAGVIVPPVPERWRAIIITVVK